MHSRNMNSFKTFTSNENPTFMISPSSSGEQDSSECMDQEIGEEIQSELTSGINNRIQYYREENAKFEMIFKQCKLWRSDNESSLTLDWDTKNVLDELCNIQKQFGTKELSAIALSMSYRDHIAESNNYLNRLKSTTKSYMEINEKLSKEISIISSNLEESKKDLDKIFNISNEEMYVLEKKVVNYEGELAKFEKKYPWLKNPQLDLAYISKEAQVLAKLQDEKADLEKVLSIYQGLKPDLQEATRQLSAIKKHYEELKNKFHSNT